LITLLKISAHPNSCDTFCSYIRKINNRERTTKYTLRQEQMPSRTYVATLTTQRSYPWIPKAQQLSCLSVSLHCSRVGLSTGKLMLGLRIILILELPPNDTSSTTMFPNVKLFVPPPPCSDKQLVVLPQVLPLPLWKYMKPEKMKPEPPPTLALADCVRFWKNRNPRF
jgi:hypothetical protein